MGQNVIYWEEYSNGTVNPKTGACFGSLNWAQLSTISEIRYLAMLDRSKGMTDEMAIWWVHYMRMLLGGDPSIEWTAMFTRYEEIDSEGNLIRKMRPALAAPLPEAAIQVDAAEPAPVVVGTATNPYTHILYTLKVPPSPLKPRVLIFLTAFRYVDDCAGIVKVMYDNRVDRSAPGGARVRSNDELFRIMYRCHIDVSVQSGHYKSTASQGYVSGHGLIYTYHPYGKSSPHVIPLKSFQDNHKEGKPSVFEYFTGVEAEEPTLPVPVAKAAVLATPKPYAGPIGGGATAPSPLAPFNTFVHIGSAGYASPVISR